MAEPTPPVPDAFDPERTVAVGRTPAQAAAAPQEASSNVLPAGTVLGEFEITGVIGEGGFGIVYRAHDRALRRTVALKEYMPGALAARLQDTRVVVKSEQHRETFEVGLKSFINEARLLAAFDHPALVKVYRFWAANGTAYMAMPLYEGGTLKQALKGMAQPPDEPWLRMLLVPLLDAVDLLHRSDCLHRDIAPDNILLIGADPARPQPLLLDFGAARRVIGGQTQALTVILKPGYAPIEQYDEIPGMRQGPWTDVYALGAVMHFAITGKPPPVAVGRLVHDGYRPLAVDAAGRYGDTFLRAVDAMLAARPEQRPQGVAALRALLAGAPAPPAATRAMTTVVDGAGVAPATRTAGGRAAPLVTGGATEHAAGGGRRPIRWGRALGGGAVAGLLLIAGLWLTLSWVSRQREQQLEQAVRALDAPAAPARPGGPADAPTPASASPPVRADVAETTPQPAPVAAALPRPARAQRPADDTGGAAQRRPPLPRPPASEGDRADAQLPAGRGVPSERPMVWVARSLREGRACLAARQYPCTIARAESVLKVFPEHPGAGALLREAQAAQEAALAGDWKMR